MSPRNPGHGPADSGHTGDLPLTTRCHGRGTARAVMTGATTRPMGGHGVTPGPRRRLTGGPTTPHRGRDHDSSGPPTRHTRGDITTHPAPQPTTPGPSPRLTGGPTTPHLTRHPPPRPRRTAPTHRRHPTRRQELTKTERCPGHPWPGPAGPPPRPPRHGSLSVAVPMRPAGPGRAHSLLAPVLAGRPRPAAPFAAARLTPRRDPPRPSRAAAPPAGPGRLRRAPLRRTGPSRARPPVGAAPPRAPGLPPELHVGRRAAVSATAPSVSSHRGMPARPAASRPSGADILSVAAHDATGRRGPAPPRGRSGASAPPLSLSRRPSASCYGAARYCGSAGPRRPDAHLHRVPARGAATRRRIAAPGHAVRASAIRGSGASAPLRLVGSGRPGAAAPPRRGLMPMRRPHHGVATEEPEAQS